MTRPPACPSPLQPAPARSPDARQYDRVLSASAAGDRACDAGKRVTRSVRTSFGTRSSWRPTAVANAQVFGAQQLAVTRRYLQPAVVANAQSLWRQPGPAAEPHLPRPDDRQQYEYVRRAQVQEKAVAYCGPRTSARSAPTRSPRRERSSAIPTRLDRETEPAASPSRSAASRPEAARHRSSSMAPSANEFWWNSGSGATLTFDLGTAKVIKQARWKQSNSSTHGTFKWQGSNDDTTYTDIGGTFTLGGATVQIHTSADR